MIRTVSVLGCGWLGLPLAQRLVALGYQVKGSTTTADKLQVLKNSNIIPYQLNCMESSIEGNNVADFFMTEKLFVNIPFRRDWVDPQKYVRMMRQILHQARQSGVKTIIMASSTSVYPLGNHIAKEDDRLEGLMPRSQALLDAENIFRTAAEICSTIVRFAGLYGPGREIGGFLRSGRVSLKDPEAPVNLIHLDDCLGILVLLLEKDFCGETFNACADAHPLRKDLYAHVAVSLGFKVPEFQPQEHSTYKIVANDKLKNQLGYRFIHPGPWGWIEEHENIHRKKSE